jgi:hypothetical protein
MAMLMIIQFAKTLHILVLSNLSIMLTVMPSQVSAMGNWKLAS